MGQDSNRSHSRDRYREERQRERDRRDRERERYKRRERSRSPRRDRGGSRNRDRETPKSREREKRGPKTSTQDRDQRTVFVQQLAARLRTRELIEFFEKAGKVRDASIVKDRVTNRSKGVAYVEFEHLESVQNAIALTGERLLGIPVIVQYTESEKNRQAKAAAAAAKAQQQQQASKEVEKNNDNDKDNDNDSNSNNSDAKIPKQVSIGNVDTKLTEQELLDVFKPIGDVKSLVIQTDNEGNKKGVATVVYVLLMKRKNIKC